MIQPPAFVHVESETSLRAGDSQASGSATLRGVLRPVMRL
jgi:hypothetical protein